jgi:GNAT superfamily N-acetyltransferase
LSYDDALLAPDILPLSQDTGRAAAEDEAEPPQGAAAGLPRGTIRVHPKEHYARVANPFWHSLPASARREAAATALDLAEGPLTITAEIDGRAAGMVEVPSTGIGLPDPAAPGGARWLVSPTIVVHPEHRRAGVGTALMQACADLVRRQGDLLLAEVLDFRNRGVVALALRHADLISAHCWSINSLREGIAWAPLWVRPDLPANIRALLERHRYLPVRIDLTPENAHGVVVAWLSAITMGQGIVNGRLPTFLAAYRAGLKFIDHGTSRREREKMIERSARRLGRTRSPEEAAKVLAEESRLLLGMASNNQRHEAP